MIFVAAITGEIRVQMHPPRPPRARGRSNGNERGSAAARRRRKQWLLEKFGDGVIAPCFHPGCTAVLTFDTITVDRIIPGEQGGRYDRSNIRPACAPHNSSRGCKEPTP